MPTVSVVIPTYNCAEFLETAIESVLGQTYQDLEIIVIDDGSTDNTQDIASRYAERIIYCRQENMGLPGARNRGIQSSQGKYIAFLDADDSWHARKLEKQIPILENDPSIGLVCSDFSMVEGDCVTAGSFLAMCPLARDGYVFDEIIQENFILPSSTVITRSCLSDVGLFDEEQRRTEDRELWLRICYRWKIAIVRDCLVTKRNRPGNLTSDSIVAAPYRIRLFEKTLRTFPNIPSKSQKLIRNELSVNFFDLGYDYFSKFMTREAREFLWRSLNFKWTNGKAAACLVASCLPGPVIRLLRRVRLTFG